MKSNILLLAFCCYLLTLVNYASSYKVAIMEITASSSHVIFNQRMAEALVNAGHEATLIHLAVTDVDIFKNRKQHPQVEEWLIEGRTNSSATTAMKEFRSNMAFQDESIWVWLSAERRKITAMMTQTMTDGCEQILTSSNLVQRLKKAQFDVIIVHMFDFCSMGFMEAVKPPTFALVNSGSLMDYVAHHAGLVHPASYVPPIMAEASDRMGFWDRAKSALGHTITPFIMNLISGTPINQMFRRTFGDAFTHPVTTVKRAPLIFVNSDALYELPRPTLDKIVNIGGLGMKPHQVKPLPAEYQKLMDTKESAIVFTLGSIANTSYMPVAWKTAFMRAMARFPDTQFFFRYEGAKLDVPPNVFYGKWLPQLDLLHHPKTKAFITHGGLNGLQEALNAGKPLVAIPLFADQYRNGEIAKKHGFGMVVRKAELSEETLSHAIKTLLHDDSYAAAARRMHDMMLRKPVPAETLFVRWLEFLAEFKTLDNLRPVGADLDWITFYNVDVYICALLTVCVVLWIAFVILRWILGRVCFVFDLSGPKMKKE